MTTVLDPVGPAGDRLARLVDDAARSRGRGPGRVIELDRVAPLSLARAAMPALARPEGSIVDP